MGCYPMSNQSQPAAGASPVTPQQHGLKPNARPVAQNGLIQLDIPIRFQWENAGGYCGQTCVQACSLYYGNYISQTQVRKLAGSELLLGENAENTIKKLGYEIQVWDNEIPKPQYQKYLQWIKQNIQQGYPVITCGYDPEGKNDEYDHIYLVVGVKSENMKQYSDQDTLIYMDLFEQDFTKTKFGQVYDTRSMKGNGSNLSFAIPKNLNYGIAVHGYPNPDDMFLPIRLKLQDQQEPNVTTGEDPVEFTLEVVISQLEVGKKYVLLRYDSFKMLPKKKAVQNQASSVHRFIAEEDSYSKIEKVMSNKSVFFRCVEEENLQ